MSTLLVAALAFVGYIIAYNTYGRWIARKVFGVQPDAAVPSQTLRDDCDYVPTNRWVLFGHHFTSIAGTGPIVGPAIAVFWGWLPALLWVVFGSIFIGGVHDFTALIISTRNDGQTLGEVAGRTISPRAKILFLALLSFALMLVIGVFGLVIAVIFKQYPQSVFPVWFSLPIAIFIGIFINRRGRSITLPAIVALLIIYAGIYVGCYWLPISLDSLSLLPGEWNNPVVLWTLLLLVYCFFASVLPVWLLLQPRDFINSLQLFVAMGIMIAGLLVAGLSGGADLFASAPAIADEVPDDAPPLIPILFITVACGAVSGFHSLVSSGTSSKQIARETDAQMIGYGGMLFEGVLAVLVILACCAGLGMGVDVEVPIAPATSTEHAATADTARDASAGREASASAEPAEKKTETRRLEGREAWHSRYGSKWGAMGLPQKVGAFVDGGANFLQAARVPHAFAIGLVAVLVASFAATTLDTATRLQRYVVQELAVSCHVPWLANKYIATLIAVGTGGYVALIRGPKGIGTGGLILWPLFGAVNQLLAGLALMVGVFYLLRRKMRSAPLAIPMLIMFVMPGWAMLWKIFNPGTGWYYSDAPNAGKLMFIGVAILVFSVWIIVEGGLTFLKLRREPAEQHDEENAA